MKYAYLKYGYHRPGQVAFEVTAMLNDGDDRVDFPSKAVKDTIHSSHKYNHNGYVIEKERAFNPVTDQQTTFEYVGHEHQLEARLINLNNNRKYKKSWKGWFLTKIKILREWEKEFKIIMSHLFKKAQSAYQDAGHSEIIHINFEKEEAARKVRNEQTVVSVAYNIHPHVQALLSARTHNNNGHAM